MGVAKWNPLAATEMEDRSTSDTDVGRQPLACATKDRKIVMVKEEAERP